METRRATHCHGKSTNPYSNLKLSLIPNLRLTAVEQSQLHDIFDLIDEDGNGFLEKGEIKAVHAGDHDGFFRLLDGNDDKRISRHEWHEFFRKLKTERGEKVLEPTWTKPSSWP